uniref:Thioredoxin domain-containing protein n=1 Tax=viral metagenome TaxID=1070528 RepID=A0A6C0DRR0_9ZZZZ
MRLNSSKKSVIEHRSNMATSLPLDMALYVGLVLIALWVGYRLYLSFAMNSEGFTSGGTHKFVMYYADWCGHCQTTKPTFTQLGSRQTIGGKTVDVLMVNPETNPELATGPKIAGYPTIRLLDSAGTLVAEYNGDRSLADFQRFLAQNVK